MTDPRHFKIKHAAAEVLKKLGLDAAAASDGRKGVASKSNIYGRQIKYLHISHHNQKAIDALNKALKPFKCVIGIVDNTPDPKLRHCYYGGLYLQVQRDTDFNPLATLKELTDSAMQATMNDILYNKQNTTVKNTEVKQFKVRIKGEKYDSMGPGDLFILTYTSTDELKIWREIAKKHAFCWDPDDREERELTVDLLIKRINAVNGDGCDAIFTAEHEVDGVFIPVPGLETLEMFDSVLEIDLDAETEDEEEDDENNNW